MLYLLRSFCKDNKSILKAGYSKDFDYRFQQYKSHNPGIEKVLTREGDELDETRMHLYLRALSGGNALGNEWYEDKEEIISAFQEDYEKIDNYLWEHRDIAFPSGGLSGCPFDSRKSLKIYSKLYNNHSGELILWTESVRNNDTGEITIIKESNCFEIDRRYYMSFIYDPSTCPEHSAIIEEFNRLTQFPDKMKLLCDNKGILDEKEFERLLDSVPMIYKNYYLVLGEEKIKAFSYRKAYLEAEYQKQLSQQENKNSLEVRIYQEFIPGNKYSKSQIKEKLGEIYKEVNYIATPKASDLERWFETALTKVLNVSTGKYEHAFKLIKAK